MSESLGNVVKEHGGCRIFLRFFPKGQKKGLRETGAHIFGTTETSLMLFQQLSNLVHPPFVGLITAAASQAIAILRVRYAAQIQATSGGNI
jgi:hypothetical protein